MIYRQKYHAQYHVGNIEKFEYSNLKYKTNIAFKVKAQ